MGKMRRKGRCTFKNWEAGSAKEITDSKCDVLLRIKFEYLSEKNVTPNGSLKIKIQLDFNIFCPRACKNAT